MCSRRKKGGTRFVNIYLYKKHCPCSQAYLLRDCCFPFLLDRGFMMCVCACVGACVGGVNGETVWPRGGDLPQGI